MRHAIDHMQSGIPMSPDLQMALIDILDKLIPKIKNEKGYHENGLTAWENAMSVHDARKKGNAKSLEEAFAYVAEQICHDSGLDISEEAIKKQWAKFGSYVTEGTLPPFELLGDLMRDSQGNEK